MVSLLVTVDDGHLAVDDILTPISAGTFLPFWDDSHLSRSVHFFREGFRKGKEAKKLIEMSTATPSIIQDMTPIFSRGLKIEI